MKFLLWAILIFAVVWVLRNKAQAQARSQSQARPQPPSPRQPAASGREIETMLRCAHCGTHFPASEAVFDSAHAAFCCSEHRQRHAAR
ncbi:MAG TPA: PP0621 family protein [Oxalicibacterium sp.]|nr:PP0621 family protein [Oxalicibacterium sp.]